MQVFKNISYILVLMSVLSFPLLAKGSFDNIVMSKLNDTKFDLMGELSSVRHKIVGNYTISNTKDASVVIAATYSKDGGCHACGAKMSFFFFKDNKLQNSYLDSIEFGSYGKPPKENAFEIEKLVDGTLVLFYSVNYSNQGIDGRYLNIYKLTNEKLPRIFYQQIGIDTEASGMTPIEKWQSTYRLDGNSNLILDIQGSIGGKALTREVIFKFDGTKYEDKKIVLY